MERFPNSEPDSVANESKTEIKINATVLDKFEEFWLNKGKDIKEIVDPVVEKFTDENAESTISFLVDNDGRNAEHTGYFLYKDLSKALDINPNIRFVDYSDSGGGFYDAKTNTVVIKKKDGVEFDLKDIEPFGGRLSGLAHEMFHAYQTKISKTNNHRANLYSADYNCASLASTPQELIDYFCQPIEAEAYYFEYQISKKLASALEKAKNSS